MAIGNFISKAFLASPMLSWISGVEPLSSAAA
jgi:hypothetical protein